LLLLAVVCLALSVGRVWTESLKMMKLAVIALVAALGVVSATPLLEAEVRFFVVL
jgi:hypothetical protein